MVTTRYSTPTNRDSNRDKIFAIHVGPTTREHRKLVGVNQDCVFGYELQFLLSEVHFRI